MFYSLTTLKGSSIRGQQSEMEKSGPKWVSGLEDVEFREYCDLRGLGANLRRGDFICVRVNKRGYLDIFGHKDGENPTIGLKPPQF